MGQEGPLLRAAHVEIKALAGLWSYARLWSPSTLVQAVGRSGFLVAVGLSFLAGCGGLRGS